MFSREAGLYMWRTIPFDKIGWDNVEQHYKDAVMHHLGENFNLDEVERDYEAKNLKDGMRTVLMKRGAYNRPQINGAAMVLQLPRIKKRWESGEDGTAGWGLNLLPTRPRTRPQTCRLRKLGRKNPFPR
ncbi:hypothetical protein Hanom_Chr07g00666871 [Helianthus anomalus]